MVLGEELSHPINKKYFARQGSYFKMWTGCLDALIHPFVKLFHVFILDYYILNVVVTRAATLVPNEEIILLTNINTFGMKCNLFGPG